MTSKGRLSALGIILAVLGFVILLVVLNQQYACQGRFAFCEDYPTLVAAGTLGGLGLILIFSGKRGKRRR